jgi:hypothetical protein
MRTLYQPSPGAVLRDRGGNAEMADDAPLRAASRCRMDEQAIRCAALITLRRTILQNFPPGLRSPLAA